MDDLNDLTVSKSVIKKLIAHMISGFAEIRYYMPNIVIKSDSCTILFTKLEELPWR